MAWLVDLYFSAQMNPEFWPRVLGCADVAMVSVGCHVLRTRRARYSAGGMLSPPLATLMGVWHMGQIASATRALIFNQFSPT